MITHYCTLCGFESPRYKECPACFTATGSIVELVAIPQKVIESDCLRIIKILSDNGHLNAGC